MVQYTLNSDQLTRKSIKALNCYALFIADPINASSASYKARLTPLPPPFLHFFISSLRFLSPLFLLRLHLFSFHLVSFLFSFFFFFFPLLFNSLLVQYLSPFLYSFYSPPSPPLLSIRNTHEHVASISSHPHLLFSSSLFLFYNPS